MSKAYDIIANYYGTKTTKRSGVLLMNHIDEGLAILENLNASQDVKDAYCLHPIFQSDEDFLKNEGMELEGISEKVMDLVILYRYTANSYLSKNKIDDFIGFPCEEVKLMLKADKIQNEKDFALYHEGTHPRSKELREYFNNWLNILLK